jgi:hypothetical protein
MTKKCKFEFLLFVVDLQNVKAKKLVFAILVIIVFKSFKKSKIAQLCTEFFL